VEISGWSWKLNVKGIGGKYTAKQRLFAALLNRRHTVAPVWDDTKGRYSDCRLQKLGPWFRDPDWIIGTTPTLHWYSYAIQVHFRADRVQVVVHIRTITGPVKPWFWEPIPSQLFTRFPPIAVGIRNDLLLASDNNLENPWIGFPYPIETRDLEQYGFGEVPMHGTINSPESLNSTAPCNFKLYSCSVEQRGEEPQQGPIDMPKPTTAVMAHSDGSTPSVAAGILIPLATPLYDGGGWWKPLDQTNQLVVPNGVFWIRGGAGCLAGDSANSQSLEVINETNPWAINPYQRTKPNFSTEGVISLAVPRLPVTPGDKIGAHVTKVAASLKGNTEFNWLYLEGITAQVEPFSATVVEHDKEIPAAGTQIWMMKTPPILDGYKLTHIGASLGSNKSTEIIRVALVWIRKAGRVVADITDDPIQIDADHWTSETSSIPVTILGSGEIANTGDIMVAIIEQTAISGTGLIIDLEFSEQQ
jgi:hypothetical protein